MPPPHTIPKYFTILMTEMRDAIIFVGFWHPPPQCPPPPLTPQYTILMTERGRALPFVGFWRPPSHDAAILNYLNDREKGRHYLFSMILAPLNPPPRRHNT